MKKTLSLLLILPLISLFFASCGGSEKKPVKQDDPTDPEVVDTDTDTDPADTGSESNCGNNIVDEGETCDGGAMECSEINPNYTGYAVCKDDCTGWDISSCILNDTPDSDSNNTMPDTDPDTGDTAPSDLNSVFNFGPYMVNLIDVKSGADGASRDFRIYEPAGAEGNIPVIHFLHGFSYKIAYYDDFLTQLASHGFVVVSSQSNHGLVGIGGDTSIEEAAEVLTFINWLKQNIQAKVSVTVDVEHFGVSGHSRGGKVTNRVLNSDPTIATSFFGVDPVDSAPPVGGSSDPTSLSDPVQFTGESMFLGTELGPQKTFGTSCAPTEDNSVHFYASYPSPSHHIIAAGVGHADMVDPADVKACGTYCSACAGSKDDGMKLMFISYTGGLMTAFFNATLKGQTQYEALLNDSSNHPFTTTVTEHK